jgi:hypothetical protein
MQKSPPPVPILNQNDPVHAMPSIPLLEDPSQYYSPISAWFFQVVSFPQVSPPNPSAKETGSYFLYVGLKN